MNQVEYCRLKKIRAKNSKAEAFKSTNAVSYTKYTAKSTVKNGSMLAGSMSAKWRPSPKWTMAKHSPKLAKVKGYLYVSDTDWRHRTSAK